MKKNVLVVSNGRGEDSIAITILEQLKKVLAEENITPERVNMVVFPLVDDGSTYKTKGYFTAATWNTLPSKGFGVSNPLNLLKDIRYGLGSILKKQIHVLQRESKETDLIVTVGDISPLLMACIWGNNKPIVHIATAISSYIRGYSLPEIWLFKKYVNCVVCRDLLTADSLKKYGVNAVYYGNPMMDDPILKAANINLGLEKKKRKIVLIPSSREDAYYNIQRMLSVVKNFSKKASISFVLSLAPNLNMDILVSQIQKHGWKLVDLSAKKKPIVAELQAEGAPTVYIVRGYFRDCLEDASAVIGMTGTGNEQIAGLGIPVILLKGNTDASSWKRMLHYKRLLGDAVFVTRGSDKKIALSITELLENNRLLAKMSETGKKRMSEPGGAYFIARKIWYYLFNNFRF